MNKILACQAKFLPAQSKEDPRMLTGGFSISDRASCVLCSVAGRDKRAAGKQ